MKTSKAACISAAIVVCIFFFLFSCRKDVYNLSQVERLPLPDSTAPLQTTANLSGYQPFPKKYSVNCSGSPSYGDSLIYPSGRVGSSDYLISPVNNPALGSYYSWPVGLVMNDSTGTIDVTKSETGMRYYIGYVKKGSQDTCLNTLIIAGSAYVDSVYTQSTNVSNTVQPYFNANSSMNSLRDQEGECTWDLSNNASHQKIWIDRHTGIIDLNRTLQDGAFGNIPFNGATLNAVIYYRLGNNSDYALQSLQIQLIYYDRYSSIPVNMLTKIQSRRQHALGNGILDNGPIPTRPPIIIITRTK